MDSQRRRGVSALRAVAVLVAAGAVMRGAADFLDGTPERSFILLRGSEALVAAGIAVWATGARAGRRAFPAVFLLALDIIVPAALIAVQDPAQVWEAVTLCIAVLAGAAVFAPWTWRWQGALALVVLALAGATLAATRTASAGGNVHPGVVLLDLLLVAAATVVGVDIAARERLRVTRSAERFKALFDEAGDAIAVLDRDGMITDANPRFVALAGEARDGLIGRPLAGLIPPDGPGAAGIADEIAAALAGTPAVSERRWRRPDGATVDLEVKFARTTGPAGTLVQAILRDVTEHRALEAQRVQAERLDALARLAGGVAHQFNNILGGILTHAALLEEEPDPAATRATAGAIAAAARRGRDLTQDILRFAGPTAVTLRAVPAGALVERIATLARSALPEGVRVETQVEPGLADLHGDPDHLAHAALQLILNAREAMGQETGTLTIAAAAAALAAPDPRWPDAPPGPYVRLTVRDTGRGMDAAALEHALEPFFSTKPMHEAAGLGLAAVAGAVRAHRGAVRIESAPGRGTAVHLLIPAAPAGTRAAAVPAPAAAAASGVTVLIVDDEEIARKSVRRALERFGYTVLEAWDGPTALAALERARPPVSVMILDLVLPGGGGAVFELARAVRPGLRVLVSSGYTPDAEVAAGLVTRADGFLQKPFELAELRRAVAALVPPAQARP